MLYLNGDLLPDTESTALSLLGQGWLVGHGIFETIKLSDGEILRWPRHVARLTASCQELGLPYPDFQVLEDQLKLLIAAARLKNARLRITLTPDETLITHADLPEYAPTAQIATYSYSRNAQSNLAGIKSISYGEDILAMQWAKDQGLDEAIWLNTFGELCEGATSNVFLIDQDGAIITPSLECGCLPGTMRAEVIDRCEAAEIPLHERVIRAEDLLDYEAGFLTSSLREIQPIAAFDSCPWQPDHPTIETLLGSSI